MIFCNFYFNQRITIEKVYPSKLFECVFTRKETHILKSDSVCFIHVLKYLFHKTILYIIKNLQLRSNIVTLSFKKPYPLKNNNGFQKYNRKK
jgi:hypothetical protein